MGRSYGYIDVKKALDDSKGRPVVSASSADYFYSGLWRLQVASAEIEEEGSLIFNLRNGDFVEVE